ncbi:TrmH family RNA methyltransferase [Cellulomonas chengniuliangii]|uniref:RNA methyltransferase n=1 Tax=Cellulomonas chengniuliangii TaxID=2968084 RepID=A0ABY5KWK6_9CELL|nr:RNA methyltransferase [Cellulomonas chengniuliangii]MCC2310192.1 RNA methyltransferase [Cellulomonas chengniuliangii]MCC2319117.1 RNA methyltransferase [Cellulomonas chengniuliangii]UUI74088.1 RNA methyltransferase [Cellulomonas chengniuliangii]
MPELANPRAERVKAVRALAGRSVRQRTGRFLVEGPQSVREAVRFAAGQVRDVYLTEAAAQRYDEIVRDAQAAGLPVRLGTPEVLEAMSADAQGVVAVLERRPTTLDELFRGAPRLVAVLANVRDPGNAGTVIRAADAAGADAVVLAGESVDPLNPKAVRSTAGSLFHLPVVAGVALAPTLERLRAEGLLVLAADGSGEHDLDDLQDAAAGGAPAGVPDLRTPTAWLFGNEAWGLLPTDRELADAAVRVPIRGRAESLNLATAATVCLYASSRAQR